MKGARLSELERLAVNRFTMNIEGIHGLAHWKRVHENGLYLLKHCDADPDVVQAFAFLHDCCRESDGADPQHGERAAEFAHSIRESLSFSAETFDLLHFACTHHERGRVSEDPTVGACWDSDRLDLGRVGIKPDRKYLSTERAQHASVIEWGWKRSRGHKARLKQ